MLHRCRPFSTHSGPARDHFAARCLSDRYPGFAAAATGNTRIGIATQAVAGGAGDTTGIVRLNGGAT